MFNEQEVLQALHDIGIDQLKANYIVECLRKGNVHELKTILLSYRSELLSSIHTCQEKLYRIDFLVSSLQLLKE